MQIITTQLAHVVGGRAQPEWSAKDFQNIQPADNRVTSPQRDHGFRSNTPMVSTPEQQIPNSVFSQMGP